MKDDIQVPPRPPAKRRQLELAPDVFLAVWADERHEPKLTPSELRRVKEERDRRRQRKGRSEVVLGFTGTREGMTPRQRETVCELVAERREDVVEAHHGDCVGADVGFHDICAPLGITMVGHPAEGNGEMRGWCNFDTVEPPKPPLDRNKDIVRASSFLIAAPKEMNEPNHKRGGTWYTVRYARQRGVPYKVVMPDGRVLDD